MSEKCVPDETLTSAMGVEPFGIADLVENHADYQCSGCGTVFTDHIAFIYPDFEKWPKYCPECGRRFREVEAHG